MNGERGDGYLASPSKCKLIRFYLLSAGRSCLPLGWDRIEADDALVEFRSFI